MIINIREQLTKRHVWKIIICKCIQPKSENQCTVRFGQSYCKSENWKFLSTSENMSVWLFPICHVKSSIHAKKKQIVRKMLWCNSHQMQRDITQIEASNSITAMVKKLSKRWGSACPSCLLSINSIKCLVHKQTESGVKAYVPWKLLCHCQIIW